jgi:hypothetical protein
MENFIVPRIISVEDALKLAKDDKAAEKLFGFFSFRFFFFSSFPYL